MNRFATIISRVFDPFLTLAVVFVLLFWGTRVFVPALLSMVVLPFVLFVAAWKTRFISNWDVNDRKERPKVLWILFAIELAASAILHTPETLPLLVALFGFTVISHVWKMSGHAMAAAIMTGTFIIKFGFAVWPVLFAVPLVGWARIRTNNHTLLQVLAGAFYSWGILIFFASL